MKKLAVWGLAAALSLTWAQAAYAGQWVQDVNRAENSNGISNWWYRQDDGSYPAGGWFWIDGNGDGFAESYRFDGSGWMYASTTVDGYAVDGSGAWLENGAVARRAVTPGFFGTEIGTSSESGKEVSDITDEDRNEESAYHQTEDVSEGWDDDFALECFELINEEREKEGREPLELNDDLMEACRIRAEELPELFSHTRPDGSACYTVLEEVGIESYRWVGENIAAGQRTPEEAVNSWMNSSGHRANILNENYTEGALGCYRCPGTGYGIYWVQLFYSPAGN